MIEETVLIDVDGIEVTSTARFEEKQGLALVVIETAAGGLHKRHPIEAGGDAATIEYNVERARHRDAQELGGKLLSARSAKELLEAGKGKSSGPVKAGHLRVEKPKPGPRS